uniref:Uncharacterized protein n=1 Tax=Monopterus albus TaxID=43700 RepID=A0A3Q3Q3Q7_MONAL|nr:dual specificity protein phosphatase 18-like [Monopterus albus]
MHRSVAGLCGLCRITDHLYLSNGRAANDSSLVTRYEITCIINVTETKNSCLSPGLDYIHIPASDSPLSPLSDHFDDVADKILLVAEGGGRTLVHCNAGVSRSAALCMAYLVKHHGVTLLEAHRWVKTCRPMVRPNNGFWKQLIRYEMELRGCASVRMVSTSMGEIPDIYEEEARNMMPLQCVLLGRPCTVEIIKYRLDMERNKGLFSFLIVS